MILRRAYHQPLPGLLFVVVTLLIGLGAANSQNNLLFLVFGLAVGAFLVSGIVSGPMMMGLSVQRELPEVGVVGEPLTISYEVTNTNRFFPAFALRVSEIQSASFLPPGEPAPSWQGLVAPPHASIAHVGPHESVNVFTTIIPNRRGVARFTGVRLKSSFPFGIFTKSVSMERRGVIPILPRVLRLRHDATAALMGRAEVGSSAAPQRGRGDDFYGLREFTSGDSKRSISWRSSARLGSLVVRENAAPRAGILMVILNLGDRPAADGARNSEVNQTLEDAISLAASLLVDAMGRGMDAGLSVPQQQILLPPGSGARHRFGLLSALASINELTTGDSVDAEDTGASVSRIAPSAARVVVHSGEVDPTFGPLDAHHLSSRELGDLAIDLDRGGGGAA